MNALSRVAAFGAGFTVGTWSGRHLTSAAVQGWTPPPRTGRRLMAAGLSVRLTGPSTGTPVVLLHGLAASGDAFGGGWDVLARDRPVLVPDLLGFGASMLLPPGSPHLGLGSHLDALDAAATELQLAGGPLTVVGHSMGAVLALHWAARAVSRGEHVRRVVCLSAPLYDDVAEARQHIQAMGLLERWFAGVDGATGVDVARITCGVMCRARPVAQWISVAVSPGYPVRVARHGVRHTWPAYEASLETVVMTSPWRAALTLLSDAGVDVVFAEGARDPVPVPGRTDALASGTATIHHDLHPVATHDLPMSDPAWCAALVTDVVGTVSEATHARVST